MGVQGLWDLLAPVGRRVSVETLAGKKLAIDASIWMVQFMKAMRDERGEMVRNAHLLGFFRRICKLLFLRTKPVFVFDGATPALKRRTVAARRRHRDAARAKIRKTAEKLLLNHLKKKKLEELAAEINNSRADNDGRQWKQVAAEDLKGKRVLSSEEEDREGGMEVEGTSAGHSGGPTLGDASAQESLDELLAASLAAEEERKFVGHEAVSAEGVMYDEEGDDDEDEEMIFPITSGNIDPTVLAAMPPSLQLDLLVQMRERVMAENRLKYQKIKKAPAKFSELQIQSYLKTVAFRREIDEVQKCAAGRGLGGVQTSRIASEANREFIFSSSFTGDKQMLASKGVEKREEADHHGLKKPAVSDSVRNKSFTIRPQSATKVSSVDELLKDYGPDVGAYYDESGRVRVSRVKGLGMHMTRDLQRNLDFMKEYEQENKKVDVSTDPELNFTTEVPDILGRSEDSQPSGTSVSKEGNNESVNTKNVSLSLEEGSCNIDVSSVHGSKDAIEISFEDDYSRMKDKDDDIFLHLVSGSSTSHLFSETTVSDKFESKSESESIWEEGGVELENGNQNEEENQPSLIEKSSHEEDEVDWEEGDVPEVVSHRQADVQNVAPSRLCEEEADIQEAIRRSLEDLGKGKSSNMTSGNSNLEQLYEDQISIGPLPLDSTIVQILESDLEKNLLSGVSVSTFQQAHNADRKDGPQTTGYSKNRLSPSTLKGDNCDGKSSLINESKDDGNLGVSYPDNVPFAKPIDGNHTQIEKYSHTTKQCANQPNLRISVEDFTKMDPDISMNTPCNLPESTAAHAPLDDCEASQSSSSFARKYDNAHSEKRTSVDDGMINIDGKQEQEAKKDCNVPPVIGKATTEDHVEPPEVDFSEEISILGQECVDLGDEQRRLERNAESVSSEMFAECQELLQMFGLPFIIAPTEAEAQCAYMEVTKLVDGVVTDDSDVFLFGARNVYKNIFDDRKYVETYFMKDIETELGLTRDKLVRMALLLGSDYTEGVSGIGIVNAIEVVHAFPEEDGLEKFREWIESPDPAILGKLDSHSGSNSRKRSLKASDRDTDGTRNNLEGLASEENFLKGHEQPSTDGTKEIFMRNHRNVSKNWHIPSSFPSQSVISAYTSPQVDESTEPFSWGMPDLLLLRKLCWESFGWSNQKADELLLPVIKEYNKHETQLRLEAFYTFNERFAKIRSQRIKKAVKGITGSCTSDLIDNHSQEGPSSKKRKKLSPATTEERAGESVDSKGAREASKLPKPRRTKRKYVHPQNVLEQSPDLDQGGGNQESGSSPNVRGRGRGRGGRRGRDGGKQTCAYSTTSSADDSDGSGELKNQIKLPEAMPELRRSMRQKKHIKYAEEDFHADDLHGSSDKIDRNGLHKATGGQEMDGDDREGTIEDSSGLGKHEHQGHEEFSGDYLSGGGFCLDGSDIQGSGVDPPSQMQNIAEENSQDCVSGYGAGKHDPDESSLFRDYLLSGGGFCTEETEDLTDAVKSYGDLAHNSVEPFRDMAHVSENSQTSHLGGSSGQDNVETIAGEPGQLSSSVIRSFSHEGEAKSSMSAMPSLRRKRRKS